MILSSYDVYNYTENQLFDILQIVNPTDRELEAKINYYISKYKTLYETTDQKTDVLKIYNFFLDMYDYFFADSDEEVESCGGSVEGFDGGDATAGGGADAATKDTPKYAAEENIPIINQVSYTQDPNKLNPILKQTVSTMLTIDSSYREDKYFSATNFSFNLSRPLRDVISLKLYAIQIPYTWWTINNYFGGNFFYIKGNVPGIDNGNHDYKIIINSGNYTGDSLTATINDYIYNVMPTIYTDVSFAGTYLEYIPSNSVSKMHVNIKKQFVETDYNLVFEDVSATLQYNSVNSFFGYDENTYDFNSLYSNTKSSNSSPNQSLYVVDDTNNTFKVIQYTQTQTTTNPYGLYDSTTSVIYRTHEITIANSSGSGYTETALLSAVSTALSSYDGFVNSSMVKVSTGSDGSYYYHMKIQLNRFNNFNVAGAKLAVVFPQESSVYPVWSESGNSSSQICAFEFADLSNELSNLVSTSKPKPTSYTVLEDLSFSLICVSEYYTDPLNDYFFDVSSSLKATGTVYSGQYVISEYMGAINQALDNTNRTTYSVYNPTGVLNISNTYAYLENSTQKIRMQFDINKTFNQTMFSVDLSASFFYISLGFSAMVNDISAALVGVFPKSSTYVIASGTGTIYFYAKSGNGLSTRTPFVVSFPEDVIYKTLDSFVVALNSVFTTFTDEYGEKIFSKTVFSYSYNIYNEVILTMNIKLNKTLTENDYRVVFYGGGDLGTAAGGSGTTNYWLDDLKMEESYLLEDYAVDAGSGIYYSSIVGSKKIDVVNFVIDASNDTILLVPQSDGVAGSDNITFTIPHGTYSQTQIINELNSLFAENSMTTGSYVYINSSGYTVFRIYVNKLFTALDWKLVFFDLYSFVQCSNDTTSVSAVWDATLGWLLGFQSMMEYPMDSGDTYSTTNTYTYDSSTYEVVVGGDAVLNTNRINSLIICLNDYNQNHLNNSLVTVVGGENTVALPSYASYYQNTCSAAGSNGSSSTTVDLGTSGGLNKDPSSFNSLSQKQVFAIQQITEANSAVSAQNIYTKGPDVRDVFAIVPVKITGLLTGQTYCEFSGSLQNQKREYFGPVNIQRMKVTLYQDNGQIVDLNGSNWSFTIIVEQMYSSTTKTK